MSEEARIGSIISFHLSELWKAKFSIACDVIFLVRLQEILTLITLTSERVKWQEFAHCFVVMGVLHLGEWAPGTLFGVPLSLERSGFNSKYAEDPFLPSPSSPLPQPLPHLTIKYETPNNSPSQQIKFNLKVLWNKKMKIVQRLSIRYGSERNVLQLSSKRWHPRVTCEKAQPRDLTERRVQRVQRGFRKDARGLSRPLARVCLVSVMDLGTPSAQTTQSLIFYFALCIKWITIAENINGY